MKFFEKNKKDICWFIVFCNILFISDNSKKLVQTNIDNIQDKKIKKYVQYVYKQFNDNKDIKLKNFQELLYDYNKNLFPIKNGCKYFFQEYLYNFVSEVLNLNIGTIYVGYQNKKFFIQQEKNIYFDTHQKLINEIQKHINQFDYFYIQYIPSNKQYPVNFKKQIGDLDLDSVAVAYEHWSGDFHGIAYLKVENNWYFSNNGIQREDNAHLLQQSPPLQTTKLIQTTPIIPTSKQVQFKNMKTGFLGDVVITQYIKRGIPPNVYKTLLYVKK